MSGCGNIKHKIKFSGAESKNDELKNMNKKFVFIILAITVAAVLLWGIILFRKSVNIIEKPVSLPQIPSQNVPSPTPVTETPSSNAASSQSAPKNAYAPPLDRASERITKKTFGQFITPQNSPVQPEKFRGYHTGTDFEIFPEELNSDVPVKAVCGGRIALKKTATGYGGVLVESCELNSEPVTVIYGHLKLASIKKNTGDSLAQGEEIGILGKAYSAETSGERKHLHLGIHKGAGIDILGYVQSKGELSGWLDPCLLETVCK